MIVRLQNPFLRQLRFMLVGLGWCVGAAVWSPVRAQTLDAIPLQYRTAEDVIPVLQPLVEPGGVITGTGDVLLLRTTPANAQQIRTALAAIDRAPRQLLITVGQATASTTSHAAVQGKVTVRDGESRDGDDRATVDGAIAARGVAARDDIQSTTSVRTLEGMEAYLMLGESRPFTSVSVLPGRHGPTVAETTEYRDLGTGLYVTPRVVGDRITLEISPQQQRASNARGRDVIVSQRASTTVTGRLGEWIEIASAQQSAAASAAGLLVWRRDGAAQGFSAWVKVEASP